MTTRFPSNVPRSRETTISGGSSLYPDVSGPSRFVSRTAGTSPDFNHLNPAFGSPNLNGQKQSGAHPKVRAAELRIDL
ncbi:MAG TPA: hypothetical protein VF787_04860 [Thermoanaerobaculia bacterium]